MTDSNETQTVTYPLAVEGGEVVQLVNRDKSIAGVCIRHSVEGLAAVMTAGGKAAEYLAHCAFLGNSSNARNHIKADRGNDFSTMEAMLAANEAAAENRGGSGEGLVIHREAIASLVAQVAGTGKSAKAVETVKKLASNVNGLTMASQPIREKMLAYIEAWGATLEAEELERFERTITRLIEACDGMTTTESDDF